ncbi:MAG: thermonuclease family protein [Bacteroidetes bacterium]|nr:thermonuclease family protein [Bacteroidota bacterium]
MSWKAFSVRRYLLLGTLLLTSCQTGSQDLYTVVRVGDGDTLTLLDNRQKQMRVRLFGIDAPERGQPYGKVATKRLRELTKGGVRLKEHSKDQYGRILADVYNAQGEWLNLKMVQEGMAWHFTRYSQDPELARAELNARARGLGLWEQSRPQAPWDYRRNAR